MEQVRKAWKTYSRRFGMWDGLKLYLKFRSGKLENIKVPNVKHPLSLRPSSSDVPTFFQVFLDDEYRIPFSQAPKVIIDGGANIGLFSIKMKNQFPDASIVCVEPDPENFQMLQKNLSQYGGIQYENRGIWNKDTRLKVYDKYDSGKWGMIVEEDLESGSIDAISLDSLFKKYELDRVDVLKLDIETSEKKLFSEGYEKWLPKVKMVIIELHDWMEPGCSKPFFSAINNSFTNYAFTCVGENVVITNLDIP